VYHGIRQALYKQWLPVLVIGGIALIVLVVRFVW
jgi:hypothetical protein